VLCDRKWPILALDSGEMTLEDIFLKLTSEDAADFHKSKPKVKPGGKKYESIIDGGQQEPDGGLKAAAGTAPDDNEPGKAAEKEGNE
jgi:hypothetical protein